MSMTFTYFFTIELLTLFFVELEHVFDHFYGLQFHFRNSGSDVLFEVLDWVSETLHLLSEALGDVLFQELIWASERHQSLLLLDEFLFERGDDGQVRLLSWFGILASHLIVHFHNNLLQLCLGHLLFFKQSIHLLHPSIQPIGPILLNPHFFLDHCTLPLNLHHFHPCQFPLPLDHLNLLPQPRHFPLQPPALPTLPSHLLLLPC